MSEPINLILDTATLESPVRALLESESAQVEDWTATQLSHQGNRIVYRVAGTARDANGVRPWSLVLKVIRLPSEDDSYRPSSWAYWEREALIYRAGIVNDLPGGLRAARCYGAERQADGSHWLWLEALDQFHAPWPFDRYGLAATHFGAFNGAYLAGRSMPSVPWLAPEMLRDRMADLDERMSLVADPATWELPIVRAGFPLPVAERCQEIAARRANWLDLLAHLPHTFCHLDAWRGNLFAGATSDCRPETIAIDWALCGYAPPGQEIAALVWVTLLELLLDPTQADVLEQAVLEGYLDGLRSTGWRGDEREVRFAYLVHALLHWAAMPEALLYACDPQEGEWAEAHWSRPRAEVVSASAAVTYKLLERVGQAEELFASLSGA